MARFRPDGVCPRELDNPNDKPTAVWINLPQIKAGQMSLNYANRCLKVIDTFRAVLNDKLEDVFRHRSPGFQPTNDDQVTWEA
jgi:hypothetical protein